MSAWSRCGAWLAAVVMLAWVGMAEARIESSAAGGPGDFPAADVAAFAKQVEGALAARGARVALLARVGRPPATLPRGIRYTHTAFAVYSAIERADGTAGRGYAIYNLYQYRERPDASYLAVDYPADFFAAAAELRAGVVIPAPALQEALLEVIGSARYAALHNPRYSVMSNPFDLRYQNCTEHVLDVVQAALYGYHDRGAIKQVSAQYFEPQPVAIGRARLWLGSLFHSGVALDDHDRAVATATFTTIARYLERYGLLAEQLELVPGHEAH
ncbi:MAG: DUF2145 domain-containing protein [Gammaproteobacteria bacterium]